MSVSQRLYLKNCILKISGDSRCRLSPLNDFYCLVQRCNFWAVESLFSLTVAAQNIRVCYPRQKLQYLRLLFYQILKFKAICFDSYFYVFGLLFFRKSITVKIVIGGALVIISAPWQYCSKQKENEDESNKYTT